MKNLAYKTIASLFAIAVIAAVVVSCKKETEDTTLPRFFTPGAIKTTNGETQAIIEWRPSLFTTPKSVSYTVQVSKTSAFSTIDYSVVTDTTSVKITDANVAIKQDYFVRVKANGANGSDDSNWMVGTTAFRILGEQIFLPIVGAEIKNTSATLRFKPSPTVTKIVVKPASGASIDVPLTATDVSAQKKLITGLTRGTTYTAEIFAGTVSKGTTTFTTSSFTIILSPSDDLATAIANAANGEVIGLDPGTYDNSAAALEIRNKTISVGSTSGNPLDTKVLFKEFTLKGTGAGIKLSGIEFDGTAASAGYFLNLTGLAADGDAAVFTSILVENSIIHGTANSLLRANRATANNGHKIDFIKFDNDIIYDNGAGGFDYILLDKLEFKTLELTRSTFYNSGRRLISVATNITFPQKPTILVDQITVNGLGFGARDNVLLDANGNNVDFTLKNSIIANIPKAGQTVGNNAYRVGSGSTVVITNNNMFKLTNGSGTALAFAATPVNNKATDLGWTPATTSFALPAGSDLRTSGLSGGPIGDPRWAQ